MLNIILLLLIMLLLICIFNDTKIENMVNFGNYNILASNEYTDYDMYRKTNIPKKTIDRYDDVNCCLVKKEYIPDGSHGDYENYGGKFIYEYNKLKNEECELNHFRLDSNKQLFFDKTNKRAIDLPTNSLLEISNNWSNENCNASNSKLGSCRNNANICIDFVDNDTCNKYNMIWANKTCNDKIDVNLIKENSYTEYESNLKKDDYSQKIMLF
jgi:hypothetical protein